MTKWTYRSDVDEDPYVSYDDYGTDKKGTILYFEGDWDGASFESDNFFKTLNEGGGLQVWIDKNTNTIT
jgi:hypothetical protein